MKHTDLVKSHLLMYANAKGEKITKSSIDALFECGAMQYNTALEYVVKSEYFAMKKGSDITTRSAIIDLSIKWAICETKVKTIIYKTPHLKC